MDGVYSCCDRTESEGMSDIVPVGITEVSQTNCRYDFGLSNLTLKENVQNINH